MARPMMKAAEVGAAAEMTEPISKTTTVMMKTHLAEKKVYRVLVYVRGLKNEDRRT